MRNSLVLAACVAAALTQACTGGEVTDPNGNVITGTNGQYEVTFHNTSSGANYYTDVDVNGYFSYDPYAPASTGNNAELLPGGSYLISVGQFGNSYTTPYALSNTYLNSSCTDHWVNSKSEPCALFQLRLLDQTGTPPAPYQVSALGYTYTVVPLAPAIYPSITWTQSDRTFTITGSGYVPNQSVFLKALGATSHVVYEDPTITASSNGTIYYQLTLCIGGEDKSVVIVAEDLATDQYSNTLNVVPPQCSAE